MVDDMVDEPAPSRIDSLATIVAADIERQFFRDDWIGGVGQRRAAITVLVRDAMLRAVEEATKQKEKPDVGN